MDYYYKLIEREDIRDMILREFGYGSEVVPYCQWSYAGEVQEGGKPDQGQTAVVSIIDGGFSKAYQKTTGTGITPI